MVVCHYTVSCKLLAQQGSISRWCLTQTGKITTLAVNSFQKCSLGSHSAH